MGGDDDRSPLKGKVAVVVGGAGNPVGRGAIAGLLHQGAEVIVPAKSEEKLQKLMKLNMAESERVHGIVANIMHEDDAIKLRDFIHEKFGRLDHVVSALGKHWQKGITTDQSLEEFQQCFTNLCGKHFVAAKALLPYLSGKKAVKEGDVSEKDFNAAAVEDSDRSYILLTGKAGEVCTVPETGLYSVGSAGLHGLALALRAEAHTLSDRGLELKRQRENGNKMGMEFTSRIRFLEVRVGVRVVSEEEVNRAIPSMVGEEALGNVFAAMAAHPSHTADIVRFDSRHDIAAFVKSISAHVNLPFGHKHYLM